MAENNDSITITKNNRNAPSYEEARHHIFEEFRYLQCRKPETPNDINIIDIKASEDNVYQFIVEYTF